MAHTLNPAAAKSPSSARFHFPNDTQAWWGVSSCLAVGWLLSLGMRMDPSAAALALAALSLFFGSEWFSRLAGRSREGHVEPSRFAEPLGLGLLALTLASLISFVWICDPIAREAWGGVITGVACMVALMFILRLEWRALDGRLVYLTHLILTLPTLMFGFVAWGVFSPRAFGMWILPAAYFPAQALFSQFWMEGREAPRAALSIISGPILLAVLLQATRGAWVGVAFCGLFLLWSLIRLYQRRRAEVLPCFKEVGRLNWEIQAWNLAAIAAWALSFRS
jgi:hypothetical protein